MVFNLMFKKKMLTLDMHVCIQLTCVLREAAARGTLKNGVLKGPNNDLDISLFQYRQNFSLVQYFFSLSV